MAESKSHERVNDILLGPLERPALAWLSAHMPHWMTPDKLTIIGIGGALLIGLSYTFSDQWPILLWVASLGLLVNWFGDSLDGTLARYRKIERPRYGYFIDHAVDAINSLIIVLGLGLSPYVRFDIACLALIGYLLMLCMVFLRTYVDGVFKISYGRLGPTEIRAILILLNGVMFFLPLRTFTLAAGEFSVFDLIVGGIAILLVATFMATTARQGKILRDEESQPQSRLAGG